MSEEKDILTFEIKTPVGDLVGTYNARPAFEWLEKIIRKGGVSDDDVLNFLIKHQEMDERVQKALMDEEIRNALVKDETCRAALMDGMVEGIIKKARPALFEMMEHALANIINLVIDFELIARTLPDSVSGKDLKNNLLKDAQKLYLAAAKARTRTNYETRGRKRNWRKSEFEAAITKTTKDYKDKHYRLPNLEQLATALNKRYPSKPPFTGDSLRVALRRYGISWIGIKKRTK